MEDSDKDRYLKVIDSKGYPVIVFDDDCKNISMKWDGLNLDEIEVKDVIE